jgi:hypothetical protein
VNWGRTPGFDILLNPSGCAYTSLLSFQKVPPNSLRELIEEVGVGGICGEGLFNNLE